MFQRHLQYVLPKRRDVQRAVLQRWLPDRVLAGGDLRGRVLQRSLHQSMRIGRSLFVYQLLERWVYLHGRGVLASVI
jgi:hypothetical protein